MTKKATNLYFHQPTGSLVRANRRQARKLNKDWHRLEFTKNEKGEDVMRFKFVDARGVTATVDVKETETPVEALPDGNTGSE